MTKTNTETESAIINASKLAELLDVSSRQIYVMAQKGTVIKSGRGFARDASVTTYLHSAFACRSPERALAA
jgi:phage terminase Nu1 subunit (DNA packaging protein)